MSKAKINFDIEEQVLARAQAFAAEHRVSLSKLVTTFFASLGGDPAPAAMPSKTRKILVEFAVGKVSLADATRELGLQDAGFLLQMMREEGLPLPALDPGAAKAQAQASFDALQACMLPEPKIPARKASRGKRAATA